MAIRLRDMLQDFKLNVMRWHLLPCLGKLLFNMAQLLAAADYKEHYRRDLGQAALQPNGQGMPLTMQMMSCTIHSVLSYITNLEEEHIVSCARPTMALVEVLPRGQHNACQLDAVNAASSLLSGQLLHHPLCMCTFIDHIHNGHTLQLQSNGQSVSSARLLRVQEASCLAASAFCS